MVVKMKNAIKVLCFVLAVLIIGTAGTYFYFTWDKGEFEIIDGTDRGTVMITGYVGDKTDVVIPKRLRAKKVVSIDEKAFEESNIVSVEIGGNVKTVGKNAFKNCKSLKSVKINDGVRSLGESAFFGCTALESVSIPKSLEKLNDAVFFDTAIKSLDFSKNEYFIEENGVVYDKQKTTLYFALSTADLSEFTCPDTVTSIGNYAFANHKEIKNFKINDGVKILGTETFYGCTGMTELRLPTSVVAINPLAISNSGIKKIYIPKQTVTIDKTAFYGMEKQLTIVTVKGSTASGYATNNKFNLEIADSL